MSIFKNIWVFAEKKDAIAELCAGGRTLGETVSVIFWGSKAEAQQVIAMGADRVYWLGEADSSRMLEDYTLTIAKLIETNKPDLLLCGTTKRCKLIIGRLAAKFKTSVLTDAMEFTEDGSSLLTKRMVYGGAAIRSEKSLSNVILATVAVGVFERLPEDTNRQGQIEETDFVVPNSTFTRIERRAKQGESVNLAAAKRVVSIGRGIVKQEDIEMIKELASLLGAEIGCTRPIAEGVNWMPRERYIGVSGVMFKPELYIGIGLSGQIQHMVGCNQARTIVAINKDKAAPIFNQTDYGLVGDLYKAVPLLIEKLKAAK